MTVRYTSVLVVAYTLRAVTGEAATRTWERDRYVHRYIFVFIFRQRQRETHTPGMTVRYTAVLVVEYTLRAVTGEAATETWEIQNIYIYKSIYSAKKFATRGQTQRIIACLAPNKVQLVALGENSQSSKFGENRSKARYSAKINPEQQEFGAFLVLHVQGDPRTSQGPQHVETLALRRVYNVGLDLHPTGCEAQIGWLPSTDRKPGSQQTSSCVSTCEYFLAAPTASIEAQGTLVLGGAVGVVKQGL